jgi:hypothetical protein
MEKEGKKGLAILFLCDWRSDDEQSIAHESGMHTVP